MYRVLVVSAVTIGLLSGCVSQSRYKALESQSSAERESLEREISTLQSQRRELEGQKTVLERQLDALRDEVTRRETELAGVNQQLSSLSQESTAQRGELEGQKLALERQLAGLNDRLTDTERQAAELAAQKAQLAAEKDEEIRRLRGTYDSLVKDLEGEIVKGEIKVKQIQDRLSVQLMEKILFDSGKTEIKPQGRDVLMKVGNVLRTVHDKQIRIEGYTDSVPIGAALRRQYPTNWELSTQRATTVLRFLQDKVGVDGKYLAAVGFGPYRPVAANDTEEGRSENRRIEIVLTPLDAPGASDEAVQASP